MGIIFVNSKGYCRTAYIWPMALQMEKVLLNCRTKPNKVKTKPNKVKIGTFPPSHSPAAPAPLMPARPPDARRGLSCAWYTCGRT